MKSFFSTLVLITLLAISGAAVKAQTCWNYQGYTYFNSFGDPSYNYYYGLGNSITVYQGDKIRPVFYMYYLNYYNSYGKPKNTEWKIQISDDKTTWTDIRTVSVDTLTYYTTTNQSNSNSPWYYYWGVLYGYHFVDYTIPTTMKPGSYYLRICEKNIKDDGSCGIGYSPDSFSGQIGNLTVKRKCVTPVVNTQPSNIAVCQGDPLSMKIDTKEDYGYVFFEWYRDGSLMTTTLQPTLSYPQSVKANHEGTWYVNIIDVCGTKAQTKEFRVAIDIPTKITQEPQNRTVCQGNSHTISVTAEGTNLKYQWYKDGTAMPGATTPTINIPSASSDNEGVYQVIVNGTCGDPDTSETATIAVPIKPQFTTPLAGGTFCPGSKATLSAQTTGNILAYQWYKGDKSILGAHQRTLTIDNISERDNGFYWVYVVVPGSAETGCLADATSGRVYVGVYDAPTITEQPASADVCAGSDITLTVTSEGADLQYQWFFKGAPIPQSNNFALELNNVTPAQQGSYSVQVSSMCGFFATSKVAEVKVYSLPVLTSQPADAIAEVGETVTLTVNNQGAQEVVWLRNGKEVAKGTEATLTLTDVKLSDAGFYQAVVTNVCGSVNSRLARVTVIDPNSLVPTITVSSPTLDAGNVPFGYSNEVTFDALVMNAGNVPITVNGFSFSGPNAADFVVTAPVANTLNKGESLTVKIKFTPSFVGTSTATLNIQSTATEGASTAAISGNGVVLYTTDQTVEFGTADKNETRIKCFTINNTSSTNITIDDIQVSGTNASLFSITTPLPVEVPAGSTKEVCAEFTPHEVGSYTASFAIKSSTGGNSTVGANGTCEIASSVTLDALNAGMSIYPNPASGSVTINTGETVASTISIVDAHGAVVATLHPTQSATVWNLSDAAGLPVPSGVYNVIIANPAGSFYIKLNVVR